MKKGTIITGLDIGSSKIAAITAQVNKDGAFHIVWQATRSSKGISRGLIVDLGEAVDSVSGVLSKVRDKVSRLGDIYVNISGSDVKGVLSHGMIPLALRGREVTKTDMTRCVNVASTIHLPYDREILHRVVHRFSVDDQSWIRDPLNLYASRLSCEVYIISCGVNHIQNIYKCVNDAGYDVKEMVFTGIADASSLLTTEDKEGGILLLDIGDSITEISIFFSGTLSEIDIVPAGGQDIKGDFKESPELADLLARISLKIQNFIKSGGRVGSIILIGGLVFIDGFIEFLEEKLSYPVKVGVVKDVRGDISSTDSLKFSTAIGLARYAYEKRMLERRNIARRLSEKVVDLFNNYF